MIIMLWFAASLEISGTFTLSDDMNIFILRTSHRVFQTFLERFSEYYFFGTIQNWIIFISKAFSVYFHFPVAFWTTTSQNDRKNNRKKSAFVLDHRPISKKNQRTSSVFCFKFIQSLSNKNTPKKQLKQQKITPFVCFGILILNIDCFVWKHS